MTPDQELAELSAEYPAWRFWRAQDGHGQPRGWQATFSSGNGSVIVAADGPIQLRMRLRNETKATVPRRDA